MWKLKKKKGIVRKCKICGKYFLGIRDICPECYENVKAKNKNKLQEDR